MVRDGSGKADRGRAQVVSGKGPVSIDLQSLPTTAQC